MTSENGSGPKPATNRRQPSSSAETPVSPELARLIEKAKQVEEQARRFSQPEGPLGALFGVRTSSS